MEIFGFSPKLNGKSLFTPITSASFLGNNLIYLPTCHSTNDHALDIVKNDTPTDGQVIITSEQTNGRGQRGNKWLTVPGQNLTFSIIVDGSFLKPADIFRLNMAVSLGIVSISEGLDMKYGMTENRFPNSQLKIKWPNDIYYGNQKIGGMLIETVVRGNSSFWVVIGIGINVNQSDFQYLNATSLKNIYGREFDLQNILEQLLRGIEGCLISLKARLYDDLKKEYLSRLYRFEEKSVFKSGEEIFEGAIVDVNDEGKIGVRTSGNTIYFGLKEIGFAKQI